MDWEHSLRKFSTRLRGTNFCTSSAHFAPSFVRQPNGPECTQIVQTHQNISLWCNGVDRMSSLRKLLTQLRGKNFCTSSARIAPSFVRQPNGHECTQILQNALNRQFTVQWGWIGCIRCEKFRRDFVAQTFALIRSVLHRVL